MTDYHKQDSDPQNLPQQFAGLNQPYRFADNDEIDLKALFLVVWKGKLAIILSGVIFTVLAVAYALLAPEVWTASAKVRSPEINDYYQLHSEVKKFQPIFLEETTDGKSSQIISLDTLVEPEKLFNQYVNAFNSSRNKKEFLKKNEIFLQDLKLASESDNSEQVKLDSWLDNISATPENKRGSQPSFYTLAFSADSSQHSYDLLREYDAFISNKVEHQIINGINKTINAYREGLQTESNILHDKAMNTLLLEQKRTEVALQITKDAAIEQPMLNYNDTGLFSIQLGARANEAKSKALGNIKDLSVFEPELISINSKLKFLKAHAEIRSDIEFSSVRYIDDIEKPINRDKPKRSLIVVLGLLLGLMFGVAIVLLRHAFTSSK